MLYDQNGKLGATWMNKEACMSSYFPLLNGSQGHKGKSATFRWEWGRCAILGKLSNRDGPNPLILAAGGMYL